MLRSRDMFSMEQNFQEDEMANQDHGHGPGGQGQGQGKNRSGRSGTENRGFASMSEEDQREIARMGGAAVSEDREHMAQIGRKGGEASANSRAASRKRAGAVAEGTVRKVLPRSLGRSDSKSTSSDGSD